MRTDTATTFEVSDVVRATQPLPEVPYKQAVEALLTISDPENTFRWLKSSVPPLTVWPPSRPVEACTRYHGRLVDGVVFHPVVAAAHRAFMDHRPLRLSPDAIWLMICQAVANHVNAHAEELRPRCVRHEGKIEIEVRRDDFVKGSPENPWSEVFGEFSAQVRDHVGPAIDLFLPAFSTTGPAEGAAAEIVLLDAMQSYFEFILTTVCGSPMKKRVTMTLEGEDGNAFHLLGVFAHHARRQGWSREEIEAVRTEATAGDYDHLLQTLLRYVDDPGEAEGEEDDF